MLKDFYIQPDAPDPVLDEKTVLRIARRHVPGAQALTRTDEHGGEARTYFVDAELVLKTQRPNRLRPRTSLKKEVFFLQQLEGIAGVRVPRVLGYGRMDSVEYTLMTRMPGTAFASAALTGEPRRQALFELGGMLRRIHDLPRQPFIESHLLPGDHSPVDVHWRFGNAFDEVVDSIHRAGHAWPFPIDPLTLSRRAMRSLPDSESGVALHSNPGPEHVFVRPGSGELSGLIDFGDAYFGHPVNDLRRFPHPQDRGAIFAGYTAGAPVSEEFIKAWRVACLLTDMGVLARPPEYASVVRAELDLILTEL